MSLTMSQAGLTALTKDEGSVDGLYDDPSGYATFGVGHLVHATDKWGSFLLAAARANPTWKGKLLKTIGVTYLPRTAVGWPDWTDLRAKAVELGIGVVGVRRYKKAADKLAAAETTAAKGLADNAVIVESGLLAKTITDVLAADLGKYETAVNTAITAVTLTQAEFDALVSLAFNIGPTGFAGSTVVRKINENKYRSGNDSKVREKAIAEIESAFAAWNKSGGKVLAGLVARRKCESDRFLAQARAEVAALKLKPPTPAKIK